MIHNTLSPMSEKGEFAKLTSGKHEGTQRPVHITFVNEEEGDMPIVMTIHQRGMMPEVIRFPKEALEALGS